jgi:putative cell wall-binding protein
MNRHRLVRGVAAIVAALASVTAVPAANAATTSRIAGADRFDTAAAVSASTFATGVAVAYVATGFNYPDALAAGAAGSKLRGPVLLTRPDALPSSTAAELQRLRPNRIVILGGQTAVSSDVAQAVAAYGTTTRVAGADRFGTAAAVSADAFSPDVPVVYVANGFGYADALAGAPAAGSAGGPLLLVTAGSIPDATRAELSRLQPRAIVILGGASVVSTGVEADLHAYTAGPVGRSSGANRYDTAVAVSKNAFSPGVPAVFIATGDAFADALAGGPAAGVAPGPLLLSTRDCIPEAVNNEITRLNPGKIVLLGGTGALSPAVESRTVCAPPPPPPPPPPAPKSFSGNGTYRVGIDIPAGTYRTRSDNPGCYWKRLSGFSGSLDDIKANDLTDYHTIVTISAGDAGFSTEDCGTWTNNMSPLDGDPNAPFGNGMWTVGANGGDIAPGTWRAPGGDDCYWKRLSGFSGELRDIKANDLGTTNPVVTIGSTDVGFSSEDCGTWTRIG